MDRIAVRYDFTLGFEVWTQVKNLEGYKIMQPMAAFTYWLEALDFKDYCLSKKVPCVIRTKLPSGEYQGEWRYF